VTGPPRFRTAGPGWLELLVRKHDFDPGADDIRHVAAEQLLYFPTDDQDDVAEAGAQGVVHAVVQQRLAMRPDRRELL